MKYAVAFVLASGLLLPFAWEDQVKRVAAETTRGDPDAGKSTISDKGCPSCHTIPGIRGANGLVGPPLTRMGSRMYVAGVRPNTPENLMNWLRDPPGVDPMTAMPNLHLTEQEVRDVAAYLYTLR
jgi:cytochrome c1